MEGVATDGDVQKLRIHSAESSPQGEEHGDSGHRSGAAGSSPLRQAALFGVVLVILGFAAVAVRLYAPTLHPQVVLFVYSIPANAAISIFSFEVALLDYGARQPILVSCLVGTVGTILAGYLDWHVFVPLFSWDRIAAYRGNRLYRYFIDRFLQAPFLVIFVTAASPVPYFPFKFLAFSVRYPLLRYLAALGLARAPRYYLLLWLGRQFGLAGWILILGFVVLLVLGLWQQLDRWAREASRKGPA